VLNTKNAGTVQTPSVFFLMVGFTFARGSRVRVFLLFGGLHVRENFSRARYSPFGRVSRSRGVPACAFSSFLAGLAFARTSRVRVFPLFGGLRVRKNFSRSLYSPIGRVSRSRGVLARLF
jgi:hypothetical protein